MAKKFLSVTLVVVFSVLVSSAKLEEKNLSRHKRFVLSTISNWWYGEPTTPAPVEELPFRDDVNYVNYPYYTPTGVGAYPLQYVAQPPPPHGEDDLGRLARELGIRHIRNLPKIEEVMGLLGTNTKDETIQAIREFAATPGGVGMIESFLTPEEEEAKQEVVPVQHIIPSETVQQLPETVRNAGVHQAKALTVQTEEQKMDQTRDRFQTNAEIFQKVPHEQPGFFGRLGYYANFLNPFSLNQEVEVPLPTMLPTEKPVTVRPVVYRYPEGYDPHTKTFGNSKQRVELLEDEHKKLSGDGPFVRYPQEIQPLVRTPQHQFAHNGIVNSPIPAYIYQSGPGNPYFVDQHRLAGVPYPFPQQQVPVIDLNDDQYSPNQVQALKQQLPGQFVAAVPLPGVVNPAVSSFNGDDGSYKIDVRFNQPLHVVDHEFSASEVEETVVQKDEKTTETPAVTEETLKNLPVHTTETSTTTTTTEKKEELKTEESKVNVVTVLPDNDFNFEDVPKEIGEKVIESVSNLTADSLLEPEAN